MDVSWPIATSWAAAACFALAAISALLVLAAAGCATPKEAERVVVVTEHARIVEPGFIVPDYPSGEERWWLCTPTGLELMVPAFRREEW